MQDEGSSKHLRYLKCMALLLQVHERLEAQQSLQVLPQNEFFLLLGQTL